MSWGKIHGKKRIGNMSHKGNRVVNMEFISRVAVSLIICLAFFLSGCVSKAVEENLLEKQKHAVSEQKKLEITKPKILEITEPKPLKISEPEFSKVSEPPSLKVSEPRSLERGSFEKGNYTRPERENPAYTRCSQLKEFDERLKCANEALGITQE
jgi:hypothetical protein